MANMIPDFEPKHVAIIGLGYVGCVSASCLASIGHRVTGIDLDERKVRNVIDGRAPFYEPGLEDLVASGIASGRLTATTDLAAGLADADVAFICVGTPSEKNGNMSTDQLARVAQAIGKTLLTRSKRLIVAVRSTVFPGTSEEVIAPALAGGPAVVVSNPEFLREGQAVKDFLEPSLLVVGGADADAVNTVARLYTPLPVKACRVSLRTAEMIKYACNAFHAVKISFANEIGALAASNGISANEVMATLCQDTKLNISEAYLKPGLAFGGSCLPKDLRALSYRARGLDLSLPMLDSVLASNGAHLTRAIDSILELPATRLGIFGLAFKENTDDLRESPVVTMIEQLIGKGRELRIFDPHIQIDQIYGANKNYVLSAIPHIERLVTDSLERMAAEAEFVIIAQKPSAEYRRRLENLDLPTLDITSLEQQEPVAAKIMAPAV